MHIAMAGASPIDELSLVTPWFLVEPVMTGPSTASFCGNDPRRLVLGLGP
ncbi:hypothetical protein ACWZJV_19585 [Nocardioides sp. WG-D5]